MTYRERQLQLVNSQSASYWLQHAVIALDKRDPIDAAHDVTTLLDLCNLRVEELLAKEPR